jgi:hypothetical protein
MPPIKPDQRFEGHRDFIVGTIHQIRRHRAPSILGEAPPSIEFVHRMKGIRYSQSAFRPENRRIRQTQVSRASGKTDQPIKSREAILAILTASTLLSRC